MDTYSWELLGLGFAAVFLIGIGPFIGWRKERKRIHFVRQAGADQIARGVAYLDDSEPWETQDLTEQLRPAEVEDVARIRSGFELTAPGQFGGVPNPHGLSDDDVIRAVTTQTSSLPVLTMIPELLEGMVTMSVPDLSEQYFREDPLSSHSLPHSLSDLVIANDVFDSMVAAGMLTGIGVDIDPGWTDWDLSLREVVLAG
jgi:hypothetical protein